MGFLSKLFGEKTSVRAPETGPELDAELRFAPDPAQARSQCLGEVEFAEIVARAGDPERAAEIAAEIDDAGGDDATAWREIALAQLRGGEPATAESVLEHIDAPEIIIDVLLELARSRHVRERPRERERLLHAALEFVRSAGDPVLSHDQRLTSVRVLAQAADVKGALDLADSAPEKDERAVMLDQIGRGLARHGHVPELRETLGRTRTPFERASLLIAAAQGFSEASAETATE